MNNPCLIILSGLIIIALSGCEGTPKIEPISYPSISEIHDIPIYAENSIDWSTNSVCWVGVSDNAKWNGVSSGYAINQLKSSVQPLIEEAMRKTGYRVEDFNNSYITREKRLSIDYIILCREIEVVVTQVAEGVCYDVKLSVSVHSNDGSDHVVVMDAWSRTLLSRGESRPWPELYRKSVENLLNNPEFRKSLEA